MISVIIPVYNTALYLDKCIQSLVDQKYRDLEIILIDDGSQDESPAIMKRWAEKDDRIRPVFKEKNSGVSDSRNIGLRMAKGDYIGFVDSDDWVEPEMYDELVGQLEKTGADIVFSGIKRIEDNIVTNVRVTEQTGTILSVDDALVRVMPPREAGRYNLYIVDKLFRKTALVKEGSLIIFDPEYSFGEDVLWLMQVLLNSKTVVFCDICGYNYRTTNSGNTWTALSNYMSLKHCASALEANQQIYRILHEAGSKAENNQLQRVLYYQRYAFRTAAKQKDSTAYRTYRSSYYPKLLRWYAGNRTWSGLKWLMRQAESDVLFRAKYLLGKW